MHTKKVVEPPDPNKNYEVRDLPVMAVAKATIAFFLFTIISGFIGLKSLQWLGGNTSSSMESPYMNRRPLPAGTPALQDNNSKNADLYNLREQENVRLNSNGTDPKTGKPYIAIDEAIKQEAQAQPR